MIRINLTRPKTREGLDAAAQCFEHAERWDRAGDIYARYAECAYISLSLPERFEAVENAFRCAELSERWWRRAVDMTKRELGRLAA